MLWFDVEQRYKTTEKLKPIIDQGLWFDVEQRYKTTQRRQQHQHSQLWFDVEQRYKTTISTAACKASSCGLM